MEDTTTSGVRLTDLPRPCLTRVCRWLWSSSSSAGGAKLTTPETAEEPVARISFSTEEGKALFGLIVSCRTLHAALTPLASWAALFQALLEETRGPDHRPLPPHLEEGLRYNLPARPRNGKEPSEKEVRAHRDRVYVRTWFATLAYERWAAELARHPELYRVPSRLRQHMRAEFAHRAGNLQPEIFAACLPPIPRFVFKQKLVQVSHLIGMAMRLASVPVESIQMELAHDARKTHHEFGGTAEKRTQFVQVKTDEALQEELDLEHNHLECWSHELLKMVHGDGADEVSDDEEDEDQNMMAVEDPTERLMRKFMKGMKQRMLVPDVVRLDAESVSQTLSSLGKMHGLHVKAPHRTYTDMNWGPFGRPDQLQLTEAQLQLKKRRMMPYVEDPSIDPSGSCMGNLVPIPDLDARALRHTREDYLYEICFLWMSSAGSAVLGWRVREKIDVTAHSESDSSA